MIERKQKVKTNTATLQIRLPIELRDQFNNICIEKNINGSELIRQLLTNWIIEQKKNKKESA